MSWPPRPEIVIDQSKCENPIGCLKCMFACPNRLIGLLQTEPPPKGSREGPKTFTLITAFKILCSFCKLCENVCPKNAIKVKPPETT